MPLTDSSIKNAKPADKPFKLFDGSGLYLEVSPKGGKWWRLKYRFAGKEKRISLGTYPETSLKQARDKASSARDTIANGQDPSLTRKAEKTQLATDTSTTFEVIARQWWESWSTTRTTKHGAQVLKRMEVDIFPEIGALPIAMIKAPLLVAMAKKVESRGANDLARRALQVVGQVMRYAVGHGFIEYNPAADIKPADILKPVTSQNITRLDPEDVPELLNKIDHYEGHIRTRLAMQLMSLTFVRTSELIGAKWSEFDLDAKQWRIPAERMKMRTPHIVPLSRQSIEVLQELKVARTGHELLFPGERNHLKPMSNNTILFALYRMGYHGRMTGHGFRGVASTLLHELGHKHELIEIQLAHQERNRISAAYNHAQHLKERSAMMQAWADHLDELKQRAKAQKDKNG